MKLSVNPSPNAGRVWLVPFHVSMSETSAFCDRSVFLQLGIFARVMDVMFAMFLNCLKFMSLGS